MNERILELIKNPTLLEKNDLKLIQQELESEPYMQSLHALRLLHSYHFATENYQSVLSQTAAYTTNKKVLYQLVFGKEIEEVKIPEEKLTNEEQNQVVQEIESQNLDDANLQEEQKIEMNQAEEKMEQNFDSEWKPMVIEINPLDSYIEVEEKKNEVQHIVSKQTKEPIEKLKEEVKLEIKEEENQSNIPQFFNVLQSWIKREKYHIPEENQEEIKNSKDEAIDKFIESNYTIIKNQKDSKDVFPKESSVKEKSDDISHLMTETLAKLYLEQKLYSKSIQAYEILQQKYPERKKEFKEEIEKIKELRISKN